MGVRLQYRSGWRVRACVGTAAARGWRVVPRVGERAKYAMADEGELVCVGWRFVISRVIVKWRR